MGIYKLAVCEESAPNPDGAKYGYHNFWPRENVVYESDMPTATENVVKDETVKDGEVFALVWIVNHAVGFRVFRRKGDEAVTVDFLNTP